MFAQCKEIAIRIAEAIPDSTVSYGMYTPPTPRNMWDAGWQTQNASRSFTHFWVESQGKILDYACDQYGEEYKIADLDDKHYVKVGEMKRPFSEGKLEPMVEYPKIDWPPVLRPGIDLVRVEWPGYERYLGTLGG